MRNLLIRTIGIIILLANPALWAADAPKVVNLPAPQKTGGKPLMQALSERKSTREFAPDPLPQQLLSNLLWAANGVNRSGGQRTAPSAMDVQNIDIYVTLPEGAYLYDAKTHRLNLVAAGDMRKSAGTQGFVATAPLNLVYVADQSKNSGAQGDEKLAWSGAGVGFISQNVYLFCASEGLATVVRGFIDKEELAKALRLRAEQRIMLSQTVGYPRK